MIDPLAFSLWINLSIILIGAALIWLSGSRLTRLVDQIAEKTGLGRAFLGALLLATVTSFPEIVTTITASSLDNAPLAINNLMGGIPMQTAILAVADLFFIRGALTFFSPNSALLFGGCFLIIEISLAIVAFSTGEFFSIGGVGVWPLLLFLSYAILLYGFQRYEKRQKWAPIDQPDLEKKTKKRKHVMLSGRSLTIRFLFHSFVIIVAGWAVAFFADAFATQTNLSSSFIGATLVAIGTSLPEVSTTFAAIRQKLYTLAFSNIFGSNALMIAVLFIADLAYRKESILKGIDRSSIFLGAVGIFMTAMYLWGILERRNKTIFRMGIDSFVVLLGYAFSLVFLYYITK